VFQMLVVDAQYRDADASGTIAGVIFDSWTGALSRRDLSLEVTDVVEYIPGEFYKRELPCILQLLELVDMPLAAIVVDGYVDLGEKPGLGRYLFDALGGTIPVIGVAKSGFVGAPSYEILRGESKKPLYVTAAGTDPAQAARDIQSMYGEYRIPTLLNRVDALARGRTVPTQFR
jgi:deoxyribonuclease V